MFLFFDTETTGKYDFKAEHTAPHQPYICQLGAIVTDMAGNVKAEMNVRIKPAGWTIPADAEAVHHISLEDCETFGIPIKDALYHFRKLCKTANIIVAHNINFDLGMIRRELHALNYAGDDFLAELTPECTMAKTTPVLQLPKKFPSKDPDDKYKWPSLAEAFRYYFDRDFDGAHDAMADIRACRDIYFAYQEQTNLAVESRQALGAA